MSDERALKDRIAGRKEAEGLLAIRLVGGSESYNHSFALAMREFADTVLGQAESDLRVMDDMEAAVFERELIGFGQHKGKPIGDVPIDYLTWVADSSSNLAAYLRSDRGRARIELDE